MDVQHPKWHTPCCKTFKWHPIQLEHQNTMDTHLVIPESQNNFQDSSSKGFTTQSKEYVSSIWNMKTLSKDRPMLQKEETVLSLRSATLVNWSSSLCLLNSTKKKTYKETVVLHHIIHVLIVELLFDQFVLNFQNQMKAHGVWRYHPSVHYLIRLSSRGLRPYFNLS